MNKSVIITIVVVTVLLLGSAAYYLYSNSNEDSDQAYTQDEDGNPLFPSEAITYPVTVTGSITDSSDPNDSIEIKSTFENKDTYIMYVESNGRLIVTPGATFTQYPDGTWAKLQAGVDTAGFYAINFGILTRGEDFDIVQQSTTYIGKQSCVAGTCDTWEWINPLDATDITTIKIDSQGRVSEFNASTSTSNIQLVYDYDTPVQVQVPANFTELDVPQ